MPPEDADALSVEAHIAHAGATSAPTSNTDPIPDPDADLGTSPGVPPAESAPVSLEAPPPVARAAPAVGPESSSRPAAEVPASSVSRAGLPEKGKAALRHPLVQDLLLNPTRWRLWPAMAILRWLQRQMRKNRIRVVYRTRPTLSFPASEIADIYFVRPNELQIVVNALGLANAGSALPSADIARIIADYRSGGALSLWLDMVADRMLHAAETSVARSVSPFACAMGGFPEADSVLPSLVGHDGVLAESRPDGLSPSLAAGARRPAPHRTRRALSRSPHRAWACARVRGVHLAPRPGHRVHGRPARRLPPGASRSRVRAGARLEAHRRGSRRHRAPQRWTDVRGRGGVGERSGADSIALRARPDLHRGCVSRALNRAGRPHRRALPPRAGRAQCAPWRVRDAEPSKDRVHHARASPPLSSAPAGRDRR